MRLAAGTSGFSYTEWRGPFYPEALPESEMLGFYSERLPSVEINNTFYRMPKPELLAAWRDKVPDSFQFALKAPRRITHMRKLAGVSEEVSHLFGVATTLKGKLGPLLFQLPPFLRCDLGLLREFLSALPSDCRAALEFRHPSWFTDEVYAALAEHRAALCTGDLDEVEKSPPLVATSNFGYLRLRREDYDETSIALWAEKIAAQPWDEAFAFFKHEALGPAFAQTLLGMVQGTPRPDLAKVRALLVPVPKPAKAPARSSAPKEKKRARAKGKSSTK